MKPVLPLFIFIDACGWEIIKGNSFAHGFAPHRRRLTSVFGYSSACLPSIVSGRWPVEHRNWSYFVYDPKHSPFKRLRPLQYLPRRVTSRRIFRRWLSRFLKGQMRFRGYFDLYNIAFQHIALFDFAEKASPLKPGGLNRGPNIFDYLEESDIPYYVSAPERAEEANLAELLKEVRSERIDFAFLYWPGLDGLLHQVGNQSPEIAIKLLNYEAWIERVLAEAREHYADIRLYVFSDHGMANCNELLDLRVRIEALPVRMPRDYVVIYDSTMARFWFFTAQARERITRCLQQIPQGRIVPDTELEELGVLFPDRHFGELIFLVKEGVLIVPSDMGERPICAMHGYHPSEKHSYAVLCTNQPAVPEHITASPHLFELMTHDAEFAKAQNRGRRSESMRRSQEVPATPNAARLPGR